MIKKRYEEEEKKWERDISTLLDEKGRDGKGKKGKSKEGIFMI